MERRPKNVENEVRGVVSINFLQYPTLSLTKSVASREGLSQGSCQTPEQKSKEKLTNPEEVWGGAAAKNRRK